MRSSRLLSTEPSGRRLVRQFDCLFQATETPSSFILFLNPFAFDLCCFVEFSCYFFSLFFQRQLLEHCLPTPFFFGILFHLTSLKDSLIWLAHSSSNKSNKKTTHLRAQARREEGCSGCGRTPPPTPAHGLQRSTFLVTNDLVGLSLAQY